MNIPGGIAVYNALSAAGIPDSVFLYAFAQSAMESGGFSSAIFTDDNNASGILYTGNSNQKNATKSTKHRLTDSKMYVAHFATLDAWAIDFKRILSMGSFPPIKAQNATDYYLRLKANNYYGAQSAVSYGGMVNSWIATLQPYMTTFKKKVETMNKIVFAIGILILIAGIYLTWNYRTALTA